MPYGSGRSCMNTVKESNMSISNMIMLMLLEWSSDAVVSLCAFIVCFFASAESNYNGVNVPFPIFCNVIGLL